MYNNKNYSPAVDLFELDGKYSLLHQTTANILGSLISSSSIELIVIITEQINMTQN